ncbi:MAG: hypothetical protein J7L62_05880 [Candidatus Aminicenantes bacterium]|nr:hypothetical protein [Candidatus Aminicenantes bacterium]
MRILTLEKIDVLKTGILFAVINGLLGLIVLLLYGAIGAALIKKANPAFAALGVILIIFIPLFYAILGFIMGILGALILNLALNITRGVPIYFKEETPEEKLKEVKYEIQAS